MYNRCLNSDNQEDDTCVAEVKFCKYKYQNDVTNPPLKKCKTDLIADVVNSIGVSSSLFIPNYEILYKYDDILKSPQNLEFNDQLHFGLIFLCKTNLCNSDETAIKVCWISLKTIFTYKMSIFS